MADFGLLKPFDIDHGELDQLTQQDCFVLGYELAQIDAQLESGQAISKPVHADNKARIERSCTDANRQFKLNWHAGDQSESWLMLEVSAAPDAD